MAIPPPLTRAQLDKAACKCGKCDEHIIFLNQGCHPDADAITFYDKRSGVLTVQCARCKKEIARVLVARELIEG